MSLTHWWPLTEDLNDKITNHKLSGTPTFVEGKIGQCADISDQLMSNFTLEDEFDVVNKSFSMGCWIKLNKQDIINRIATLPAGTGQVTGAILGYSHYDGLGIIWHISDRTNVDKVTIRGTIRDYNNSYYFGTEYQLDYDVWTHIMLTSDVTSELLTLYINGENKGAIFTKNRTGFGALDAKTQIFGIGRNCIYSGNGSGMRLPMKINDVRIYNHALSLAEVQELKKVLIVHYTFDDILAEPTTNLLPTSMQSMTVNSAPGVYGNPATINITSGLINGADYTLSVWQTVSSANQSTGVSTRLICYYTDGTYDDNSTTKMGITLPQDDKEYYYEITVITNKNKTISHLGGWILDHSSGYGKVRSYRNAQIEAKDHATPYTPASRVGMLYNETGLAQINEVGTISLSTDTACGTYSFQGGANRHFNILTAGDASQGATASLWIKVPNYPSENAVVFVDSNTHLAFGFHKTQSAIIACNNYSNAYVSNIKAKWKMAEWNHIVVQREVSGTIYCYLNGVKLATSSSNYWSHSGGCTIGCRNNGSYATHCECYIDDFRLYHSLLTEDEIKELYNCGGRISNLGDALTGSFIEDTSNSDNLVTNIDWEQGGITDATGVATGIMNNRLRTKFIPILANTEYRYSVNSGIKIRGIHYYDKDLNWIKYQSKGISSCIDKTPENCAYIRWIIQYDNNIINIPLDNIATYGTTMSCANTNSDILSLAAKVTAQVNKNHSFTCLDICEDHNSSIQNNGRLICKQIIEI